MSSTNFLCSVFFLFLSTQTNITAPGDVEVILQMYFSNSFYELISWALPVKFGLKWVPQNHIDDKPTLVQVMSWCHLATSHYLSQCWPTSMLPYGHYMATMSKISCSLTPWSWAMHIQSSAVITRLNIIRYYIDNYRNWSRLRIRRWTHKRHPIPSPNGRVLGCLLWIFVRKLTAL